MDPLFRQFFIKNYTWGALAAVAVCELFILIGIHYDVLTWKPAIDYQIFTIFPVFALALLQLYYNGRLQKSEFIREYSERFFTSELLYSAFHELVYQYTDSRFQEVQKIVQELEESKVLTLDTPRPVFVVPDLTAPPLKEGNRHYHPRYFQFSLEERRMDMLIGYFDLLGYHHSQGFFSIEEVTGSLGYYLNVLSKRQVIITMRQVYRGAPKIARYEAGNGKLQPFWYFDQFMDAVEKYNEKISASEQNDV